MQRSVLLFTCYFAAAAALKETTHRQLKSLSGKTKSSLKTCGCVQDREDDFDIVKVRRFVLEFKLRRGMFDPLS